jgi:15-cis-phytoene synthase / lycopene beta-cyclase
LALRRGTWVIASATKLGWHLWPHLEIEEATFFLVTNMMIVFGLAAGSKAFAICDLLGWNIPIGISATAQLAKALITSQTQFPEHRMKEMGVAYNVLATKVF